MITIENQAKLIELLLIVILVCSLCLGINAYNKSIDKGVKQEKINNFNKSLQVEMMKYD